MPRPPAKKFYKKCEICDGIVETVDTKRGRSVRTCSKSCASKLAIISQKKIELPCKICGTTTQINQSARNLPVYCSPNCRKKKHHIKCVICEKMFYTSHHDSKTCSKPCACKLVSQKIVKYTCSSCKEVYERPSSLVRTKTNNFCSRKCASKHFSIGRLNTSQRYGKDWHIIRENRLRFDHYTCLSCMKHNSELDVRLEVHHVIPIKEFEQPDDGNYKENLRTLCSTCHHKVEKGKIPCPPHTVDSIHSYN